MKKTYAKVFKSIGENKLAIIEYSPAHDDYYSFVKKQRESGFKQVIITSELMLKLVHDYFLNRHFTVSKIEFMIDDQSLIKNIDNILMKINSDRAFFSELIDELRFLIEESSIDIKKIELKGMLPDSNYVSVFIQVNGILGITDVCYKSESAVLAKKIEGWN